MAPEFSGSGGAPAAVREFAGSNQFEHAQQTRLAFGRRGRVIQAWQSGEDYILAARKAESSRIQLVLLSGSIHDGADQVVADYGEH